MANTRGQAVKMQSAKKKAKKVEVKTFKASLKEGKKYTPAQIAAKKRNAAKAAGTYKAPKTAQQRTKDRLKVKAAKNKPTKKTRR